MKRTLSNAAIIIVTLALLSACGPTPAEIAAMTASAWTPTPLPPTPTPIPPTATPVPIDLTVTIADESGMPIPGASIVFPESGDDTPVPANEQGQYSWNNLQGETATFTASAQGYMPNSAGQTLVRGPNDVSITLQRDPFGLLPTEACAAGETWLYAEDFQDQHAQGWNEIDLKMPGWTLAPSAEEAGNTILSAQYSDMLGDQPLNSGLQDAEFDNAVWRIRFLLSTPFAKGENWFSFNWRRALQPFDLNGQEIYDSRYQIPVGTNYFAFRRLQQPATNIGIGQLGAPKAGEWHLAEISTFGNVTEIWLDGKRLMAYDDPEPLPAGTMGLELWLKGSETIVYFDNISVCELSAPFVSSVPAEP